MESNESCCSNFDSSNEGEQVMNPGLLPKEQDIPGKTKTNNTDFKPRNRQKMQWMPKSVDEMSATTEPSSTEGSDQEESKEYIYTQVCRQINKLTLELDKLCQVLPACENFLEMYQKNKQPAVMSASTPVIKDDQVPVIQVDCKVRKHWKPVHNRGHRWPSRSEHNGRAYKKKFGNH